MTLVATQLSIYYAKYRSHGIRYLPLLLLPLVCRLSGHSLVSFVPYSLIDDNIFNKHCLLIFVDINISNNDDTI